MQKHVQALEARIAKWLGPDGFTRTIQRIDVRPRGKRIHVMRGPPGTASPIRLAGERAGEASRSHN